MKGQLQMTVTTNILSKTKLSVLYSTSKPRWMYYNFLFSALRHVPSNDALAHNNRIVPWQTLEVRNVVYEEDMISWCRM